jgi:hypothetical protein
MRLIRYFSPSLARLERGQGVRFLALVCPPVLLRLTYATAVVVDVGRIGGTR